MNKLELKAELVRQGKTYDNVAETIGISLVSFNRKINDKTEFSLSELTAIKKCLNLSDKRFKEIFFDEKVS